MIVYGTKIISDIEFPLVLSHVTAMRYELNFSSDISTNLKRKITCGFPFYRAHGRDVYLYSDRIFDGCEDGQPWCYEVKDVVRFYWVSGGQTIFFELNEKGAPILLAFWFIHLVLPLYFTLEGMYDFLHAGAVEVDGKPVLFISPSMGGKSTMTDYFIRQGHPLISDDKVPTFIEKGRFMAVGSHPYHRPYRKFEDLGHRVNNFTTSFRPIHAFYILTGVQEDANVTIEEVNGFEKFDTLLPNYLYMFSWLRAKRLQYLSGMVNSIRVFHVQVPWAMERLREVHSAIYKHSRGV